VHLPTHLLTENNPDNKFRTPNNTNPSTQPLHSFCAVNRECRNMLFTLALLVGVLVVGRTSLDPRAEPCVQHHIKTMVIMGIAEMRKVWYCTKRHHISLALHISVLVGPALSSHDCPDLSANSNNDRNDDSASLVTVKASSIKRSESSHNCTLCSF
jgi:hypothetical protein